MAVRNGVPDDVLGNLYPFEDRYVQLSDGVWMHYVETGKAGFRKPTLLLLHGNPTWSFLYRKWMVPLAEQARVIAVDHVGFGRSDHPRDPAYYTLDRHVRNLEEFTARLGLKRVVPVLHDWGGPIGAGWAAKHSGDVHGLVVLNTWAFTQKAEMRLPFLYKALKSRGIGEWAYGRRNMAVEAFLPKLLMAPPSAAVMEGYRHPFPTRQSRTALLQAPRMVPDRPSHPEWATMDRIEKSLGDLTMPAAILWGAKDPAFPKRFAWAWKESLPNAESPRFFDQAGHWLQEDIPQQLVAEVRGFLDRI